MTARDDDSPEGALKFVVAQTPMWGFLERAKTTTRSGRSQTSRRVTTFTLSDLREGAVQYVPSNLSKGGPPSDSFSVYVTDGKNRSPPGRIEVAVRPPTLSLPDFYIEDLVVREGGRKEVEVGVSGEQAESTENAERLVVSMAEAPIHGSVVLETGTGTDPAGIMEVEMRDISVADLRTAGVRLVYQHDGTESRRDSFALTLSNGNQIARKSADVTIQAVNDELPRLTRNEPATVEFGGTVTLNADQLKATDVDNLDSQIYFVVLSRPKRGALQLMTSDLYHARPDPVTSKAVWIQVFLTFLLFRNTVIDFYSWHPEFILCCCINRWWCPKAYPAKTGPKKIAPYQSQSVSILLILSFKVLRECRGILLYNKHLIIASPIFFMENCFLGAGNSPQRCLESVL